MTTVRDLLVARATSTAPALRWRDGQRVRELSWQEYVGRSAALASQLCSRLDPERPPHVGVLLDNGPTMALHLAAAGWGGHVLVGLNTTRRGVALAADVARADCQFVITDAAHAPLLSTLDVPVLVDPPIPDITAPPPPGEPAPATLFMLIFTSGTGGEPKAVRVTHEKVASPGAYMVERLGLDMRDVHYISMPLFHSNGVLAGWAPALVTGATFAVAEFSASGFLPDVRLFGATYANYVGKPLSYILATSESPDDAENPLRLVFGNEAGDRDTAEFAGRFGCRVIDGFGSTENAVVISRVPGTPPGSLGQPMPGVAILDPDTGRPCAPGEVGELVNTTGGGQFAGYYNDAAATAERMRGGMYWSGDLAYADDDGWIYYAGRTSDWLRVDGENLATAPIERILLRHPAVGEAVVYGVPDPAGGDELVAALVLRGDLDPADLEAFLDEQPDLGPKQWPRQVRVLTGLPRTATNKVLKRELRDQPDAPTWLRAGRSRHFEAPPTH